MRFEQPVCPECGEPPVGTIEKMQGLCHMEPDGKGGFEYGGDTDIWWDDSESVRDAEGRMALQCENDHDWFSALVKAPTKQS